MSLAISPISSYPLTTSTCPWYAVCTHYTLTASYTIMKYTIRNFQNFQKYFPTEKSCLDFILERRIGLTCPSCRRGRLYRVAKRKCYACSACGRQTHPLAGTLFEKSSTPLSMWFYVIYIIAYSDTTPSAKELERHLGVTYKTAWRIVKNTKHLVDKSASKRNTEDAFSKLLSFTCNS